MKEDQFYLRKEVAAHWRCSERTVDRMIAEKLLAVHRIGRSIRIRGSDANAAARAGRVEASAA